MGAVSWVLSLCCTVHILGVTLRLFLGCFSCEVVSLGGGGEQRVVSWELSHGDCLLIVHICGTSLGWLSFGGCSTLHRGFSSEVGVFSSTKKTLQSVSKLCKKNLNYFLGTCHCHSTN